MNPGLNPRFDVLRCGLMTNFVNPDPNPDFCVRHRVSGLKSGFKEFRDVDFSGQHLS
jgi:hypothetical protein